METISEVVDDLFTVVNLPDDYHYSYTDHISTYMIVDANLTGSELKLWSFLWIEYRKERAKLKNYNPCYVLKQPKEWIAEKMKIKPASLQRPISGLKEKGFLYSFQTMGSVSWWIPLDPSEKKYPEWVGQIDRTIRERALAKDVSTGSISKEEFSDQLKNIKAERKSNTVKSSKKGTIKQETIVSVEPEQKTSTEVRDTDGTVLFYHKENGDTFITRAGVIRSELMNPDMFKDPEYNVRDGKLKFCLKSIEEYYRSLMRTQI